MTSVPATVDAAIAEAPSCVHHWQAATPSRDGTVECTCRLCGATATRTGADRAKNYPRR